MVRRAAKKAPFDLINPIKMAKSVKNMHCRSIPAPRRQGAGSSSRPRLSRYLYVSS